jgi:hypothetical protein
MRVANKRKMQPKVEIRDTQVTGSPIGEGLPLELARALHEMAKAARELAGKLDCIGGVGILVGDLIIKEKGNGIID